MATKEQERDELNLHSAHDIQRFDTLIRVTREIVTREVDRIQEKVFTAIEKHPDAKGFHEYTITLVVGYILNQQIAQAKYDIEAGA